MGTFNDFKPINLDTSLEAQKHRKEAVIEVIGYLHDIFLKHHVSGRQSKRMVEIVIDEIREKFLSE